MSNGADESLGPAGTRLEAAARRPVPRRLDDGRRAQECAIGTERGKRRVIATMEPSLASAMRLQSIPATGVRVCIVALNERPWRCRSRTPADRDNSVRALRSKITMVK